jgi:hypothetical protein
MCSMMFYSYQMFQLFIRKKSTAGYLPDEFLQFKILCRLRVGLYHNRDDPFGIAKFSLVHQQAVVVYNRMRLICSVVIISRMNDFIYCLQAKHATEGNTSWGVNGETGEVADMKEYGIWEAYSVKAQTYKTAIEVCIQSHQQHNCSNQSHKHSFVFSFF